MPAEPGEWQLSRANQLVGLNKSHQIRRRNATARAMQPKPAPHPIRQPRNLLAIEGRGGSVEEGRSSGIAIGAMYFGLAFVLRGDSEKAVSSPGTPQRSVSGARSARNPRKR
jgi:hypothetical protein